jgi:hypothetical protein
LDTIVHPVIVGEDKLHQMPPPPGPAEFPMIVQSVTLPVELANQMPPPLSVAVLKLIVQSDMVGEEDEHQIPPPFSNGEVVVVFSVMVQPVIIAEES